jgi:hypothetical protein
MDTSRLRCIVSETNWNSYERFEGAVEEDARHLGDGMPFLRDRVKLRTCNGDAYLGMRPSDVFQNKEGLLISDCGCAAAN